MLTLPFECRFLLKDQKLLQGAQREHFPSRKMLPLCCFSLSYVCVEPSIDVIGNTEIIAAYGAGCHSYRVADISV